MNKTKLALTLVIAMTFSLLHSETKDIRSIKYKNRFISLSPEKLKRQIRRRGLIDYTGTPISGHLDAKYLLIYFSAQWCGGCRGFTPKLAEFYRRYHEKYDFEIVFCSSDRTQEKMLKYISDFKMPWPCLARQKGNFYIKLYGSRTILPNGGIKMGIPQLLIMNMTTGKCYGVPLFGEAENIRAPQALERFKKELGITDDKQLDTNADPEKTKPKDSTSP